MSPPNRRPLNPPSRESPFKGLVFFVRSETPPSSLNALKSQLLSIPVLLLLLRTELILLDDTRLFISDTHIFIPVGRLALAMGSVL